MGTLDTRVKEIWQVLHAIPEKAFAETKTSAFIAAALEEAGYEVTRNIGKTGIVATLHSNQPGPNLAFRADMDALVHNIDGKEIAIHSCGHDAHSSMLLTAAEEIARKGITHGTLTLLFQPAEEVLGGARAFCEAGIIDNLDYLIGLHLRPIQEAPMGKATPALCHGSNRLMEVILHGVPAHGARTHLGINVINAAAAIVQAVNAIKTTPEVPATTKVTRIIADAGVPNAIPESAKISLDLRAQTNLVMEELIKKTKNAVEFGAQTVGATAEILCCHGCPAAEYSDEVTALIADSIETILGKEGLVPAIISPGSEDFHFFAQHKPSLKVGYMGIGVDLEPGLHHPQMHFNQNGLIYGVDIILDLINKLLNKN